MAQANPLTLDTSAKKLTAATAPVTAGPVSHAAWVKRAAAGSFGRYYAWICTVGSNNEGFVLGEDITGSSGNARGLSFHSGNKAGGTTTSAVQNSTWNAVLSTHAASAGNVSTFVRGANKGSSGSSFTPSGLNGVQVNGRPSDATNGIGGALGDYAIWTRLLSDTEALYLGNGGNPRYVANLANYWHLNATGATETDLVGAINLTIAGTPAAASDAPTVTTYWTASALANQSYTQGTPITSVDLTAKFDNNGLTTWTGTLCQLSAGSNVTTANGATNATGRELTVNAIGSFAAGDYVSIAAGNPTLVLQVNGSTILMGSDQTWNNGDQVNRYTVAGLSLSGLTINGSNLFSGTPGAPAVGTYNNCVFRATSGSAPVSDSNLFSITVASSGAAPSFSAGPTLNSANTDGYTYGATCNQTATWHLGAYLKGSATPSVANLKAGAGTGFVAHVTQALTAATPGTKAITGLTLPFHDMHQLVTNGSGDSAINSSLAVLKAPAAGKQYQIATFVGVSAITKASPAAVTTSAAHGRTTGDYVQVIDGDMTQIVGQLVACTVVDSTHLTLPIDSTGYTTYTTGGKIAFGYSIAKGSSTAIVTGDVFEVDAASTPGGEVITVRSDGGLAFAASNQTPRQSAQVNAYSVSLGAMIGVATVYLNNVPPGPPSDPVPPIILPLNFNSSVDLSARFTSPQGDTLSMGATGIPGGLAVVTPNLTGAVTSRAITAMSVTATDAAGETATAVFPVIAGNVDVPSVVGLDQATIIQLLQANYLNVQFGSQPDPNLAGPANVGLAIAQTPATGNIAPNSVINVTLSDGTSSVIVTPPPPVAPPSVVSVLSRQLTQEQQPLDPLSPSYLSGANSWEVADVCTLGANDQPGSLYRFFKVPSNARIVSMEALNDANPIGSVYIIGLRQPVARGGALPTNPRRIPIPLASQVLCANLTLDTERARWEGIYTPSIAGAGPSKVNYMLRMWELLGLSVDPNEIYEVVVTAKTPGTAGGNLALRMAYVR